MFGVYDGHGGDDCCNYLKDKFHSYALESFDFGKFENTLKSACVKLDEDFANKVMDDMSGDTSGSCALSLILLGKFIR
jgi:serine/threonine protein phosphatase PrpC